MPAAYLESLQNAVALLGRPVVSALASGISDTDVRAVLGDEVPMAVVDWFGWCNGVVSGDGQRNDDVAIVPGCAPVSLAQALSMRESYDGDPVLSPEWIPLLAGLSGDMYAAVWSEGKGAQIGGVLIGELTEIEFASIEQMVSCFIAYIGRGAFL